jgi:hypothetical protein
VVGSLESPAIGIESGTVYLYRRISPEAWTFETKLVASDAMAYDAFGFTVADNINFCHCFRNLLA